MVLKLQGSSVSVKCYTIYTLLWTTTPQILNELSDPAQKIPRWLGRQPALWFGKNDDKDTDALVDSEVNDWYAAPYLVPWPLPQKMRAI